MLNGGGPVVSTESGVVTLNLHTLVSQLAATLGISSQVAAVQSKLQGSTGASARAAAQKKLGITLPPANGQLVIMRSNQLKTAQDIANAVKNLAIVLPALAILLFALAVYLARGRRRRTLRTSGWCFVADRRGAAADPQNRRQRGRQRPGQGSVQQAGRARRVEHRHVAAAQHRGRDDRVRDRDRGGRLARRPNPPGDRDPKVPGPVIARKPRGRLLRGRRRAAARRAVGSDPAFRNIWWILVFAVLLALGVTMLRRETAREFPGIEHGQALHDFQAQRAQSRLGEAASPPAPGDPGNRRRTGRTHPRLPRARGASRHSSDSPRCATAARSPTTSTRPRRRT